MNKLIKILFIFFTLSLFPNILFAADEEFDPENQDTWDYNSDDVYTKIDPDDSRFDWNKADYSKVDFAKVDNYDNLDFHKIPDNKWSSIDQAKITGNKVAEIPATHFNPSQVSQANLYYANSDQIYEKLDQFENLADADPSQVSVAFSKDPYNANLDIGGSSQIKFNSQTGRLEGDFPSYDPSMYPSSDFEQVIENGIVKIIPIGSSGNPNSDEQVTISGADNFVRNEDGSIDVQVKGGGDAKVTGKLFGKVILDDGNVLEFNTKDKFSVSKNGDMQGYDTKVTISDSNGKLIQSIQGKFEKSGDELIIESYKGKQSKFEDHSSEIKITSTGYPLSIFELGSSPSGDNHVVYGDNYINAKGAFKLEQKDLNVASKSENALFKLEDDVTTAKGKLNLEDSGIVYEGVQDSTTLVRMFEGKNELIKIDGDEKGEIAEFSRKIGVGTLIHTNAFVNENTQIKTKIFKDEDGNLEFKLDKDSLGLMSSIGKDPNLFLNMENNLMIELGDEKAHLGISDSFGIMYQNSDGKAVIALSPKNVNSIYGSNLIDVNKELDSLEYQIKSAKANGEDSSKLEKIRDSYEYMVLNHDIQGLINTNNYDSAIDNINDFLKKHPNSQIKDEVKLSVAELHLAKAVTSTDESISKEGYENAISIYSELKENPELSEQASLSLASVYLTSGDGLKAKSEYAQIASKASNNELRAQAILGMSNSYLITGDYELALRTADNALKLNPNDEATKLYKHRLEGEMLGTITTALRTQGSQINDKYIEKIGDGEWYEIGIAKSVLAIAGHYDNLETIKDNQLEDIHRQQEGTTYIKILHSKGYSFDQISKLDSREMAIALELPIESEDGTERSNAASLAGRVKVSIGDALNNPDVKNVMNAGRDGQFNFQTGKGYVNTDYLEDNWQDSILDGVDVKNVLLFAGPGATLKGTSLVGWVGKGIGTGSKAILGEQRLAQSIAGGKQIFHTAGSSKIGQFLTKEINVGPSILDKSITGVGKFGGTELGETGLSTGVGQIVGIVKPEWAESASLVAEMSSGHSGAFDKAFDAVEGIAKKNAKNGAREFLFSTDGDVIAEKIGVFNTQSARDDFLDSVKDSKSGKFDNLGDGVFELDGKRYYAGLDSDSSQMPSSIDGEKVIGSAQINQKTVQSSLPSVQIFDKFKSFFKKNDRKLSPEFSGVDVGTVKTVDDLKEYVDTQAKYYGDISGNQKNYNSVEIKKIIDDVVEGKSDLNLLTRSLGIRNKLEELMTQTDMNQRIKIIDYNQEELYKKLKSSDSQTFVMDGTEIRTDIPVTINHPAIPEKMTIDFEYDSKLRETYDFEILPKADEINSKYFTLVQQGKISPDIAEKQAESEILDFVHKYTTKNTPYSASYADSISEFGAGEKVLIGETCLGIGGVCRHQGTLSAAFTAKLSDDDRLKGFATFNTGPGHGWGEYVKVGDDGTRERYIMDSAQNKNGWLDDLESSGDGSHAGTTSNEGDIEFFDYANANPWDKNIFAHHEYYGTGTVNSNSFADSLKSLFEDEGGALEMARKYKETAQVMKYKMPGEAENIESRADDLLDEYWKGVEDSYELNEFGEKVFFIDEDINKEFFSNIDVLGTSQGRAVIRSNGGDLFFKKNAQDWDTGILEETSSIMARDLGLPGQDARSIDRQTVVSKLLSEKPKDLTSINPETQVNNVDEIRSQSVIQFLLGNSDIGGNIVFIPSKNVDGTIIKNSNGEDMYDGIYIDSGAGGLKKSTAGRLFSSLVSDSLPSTFQTGAKFSNFEKTIDRIESTFTDDYLKKLANNFKDRGIIDDSEVKEMIDTLEWRRDKMRESYNSRYAEVSDEGPVSNEEFFNYGTQDDIIELDDEVLEEIEVLTDIEVVDYDDIGEFIIER